MHCLLADSFAAGFITFFHPIERLRVVRNGCSQDGAREEEEGILPYDPLPPVLVCLSEGTDVPESIYTAVLNLYTN
jgi:hypothetical protein